jgi:hypothetical protein
MRRVWENHTATRLCDFWYEAQKRKKKNVRDRGLQGCNNKFSVYFLKKKGCSPLIQSKKKIDGPEI